MFVRTEDFRTFLRWYPVVSGIVAIHLVAALLSSFFPFILAKGAGVNALVAQGEYWRLVTPIFLHGGVAHVLFNSFSLVLFGPALERILGKVKFLAVYLATGIAANIATYFLEPPYYVHVGASGAIFGLFGLYVYMVRARQDLIDRANSQIIVTILVIGLIMTFVRANINIVAHIIGLLSGLALAPVVLGKKRETAATFSYSSSPRARTSFRQFLKKENPLKTGLWLLLGILVIAGVLSRFF